ncbi:hypothetical protein K0M31_007492 [Melipona bicolor]|uniref:Uncharacterized protein n=1 Tax=Melipona bicolor TaxID=60889 RepID=A0AA40GBI3_9HYME|nr:hypothetical protein K0M31_007492 [Melipona bicolor]
MSENHRETTFFSREGRRAVLISIPMTARATKPDPTRRKKRTRGGAKKIHNTEPKNGGTRGFYAGSRKKDAVKMAAEVEGPPRRLKSFHRGPFFDEILSVPLFAQAAEGQTRNRGRFPRPRARYPGKGTSWYVLGGVYRLPEKKTRGFHRKPRRRDSSDPVPRSCAMRFSTLSEISS